MKQSKCHTDHIPKTVSQIDYSLAIGRMFGGIPESFFTTYHEYLPKTEPVEEYSLRQDLYQLYHYLNHTVLFGVRSFVSFAPSHIS